MAFTFHLPQYGMGMQDATIIRWLKATGDDVVEGEDLVEIETAKAEYVVESPVTGVVIELVAQEGDIVEIQGVLAIFEMRE